MLQKWREGRLLAALIIEFTIKGLLSSSLTEIFHGCDIALLCASLYYNDKIKILSGKRPHN